MSHLLNWRHEWGDRSGSNRRPRGSQPRALPTELRTPLTDKGVDTDTIELDF